jgi:hypothetical protein
MALGYRSVLDATSRDGDSLPVAAERSFWRWVDGKGYDVPGVADGSTRLSQDATVVRVSHLGPDGSRSLRLRLDESTSSGRWVTSLTLSEAATSDDSSWFWLDVEHFDDSSEDGGPGRWTAAPRLSRDLLTRLIATDGHVQVDEVPSYVGEENLDELLAHLTNPSRRLPVIVAAAPSGVEPARWIEAVGRLTRETRGVAVVRSLRSETADLLNQTLGMRFGVAEGTIRTYLPGLRLEFPGDARRHRYLIARRILEALDRPSAVARILGWGVRVTALTSPLPSRVRACDATLTGLEPEARRRAIEGSRKSLNEITEPQPETRPLTEFESTLLAQLLSVGTGKETLSEEGLLRLSDLVQLGLEFPEAQTQSAAQVGLLQGRIDRLTTDVEFERKLKEDVQLDLGATLEESVTAQDEVRRLRLALQESGQGEIAWQGPDPDQLTALPSDFQELLDWIDRHLPFVSFTGDTAAMLDLETYDSLGQWPGIAWTHMLAFNDYGRMKVGGEFSGSLHDFLSNTPAGGRNFPLSRYKATESDAVVNNPTYARLRFFPVPEVVDDSKRAPMYAHTRIASFAMISPRMHFLDHTATSGQVYVGYLGRHLRNPSTN